MLPDGRTAFNLVQNAADRSNSGALVFFLFDLLFLDGADLRALPLIERKARLKALLAGAPSCLLFADHQLGRGPAFHRLACEHGLEGIVSKRVKEHERLAEGFDEDAEEMADVLSFPLSRSPPDRHDSLPTRHIANCSSRLRHAVRPAKRFI